MRAAWTALCLAGCWQPSPAPPSDPYLEARARMVEEQIRARGVDDARVLSAMARVPRHEFVPVELAGSAYADHPLPIGEGQTISQPYIVAKMSELARIHPTARVLEIGTGSGYQAAILAELAGEVWSIEISPVLGRRAAATLERLGYRCVHLRVGDGYRGWPEAAPFDAILVTAAPERIPQPLVDQLRVGGRLVIPVGPRALGQRLLVVTRGEHGLTTEVAFGVVFVPMTGEAEGR